MVPHLIHGSFGPPESTTHQQIDGFSRFCRPHCSDQQTYIQTDRQTHKRLHLCTPCLWCSLTIGWQCVLTEHLKGIIIFVDTWRVADPSPCSSTRIKRIDHNLLRALDLRPTEWTPLPIRVLPTQNKFTLFGVRLVAVSKGMWAVKLCTKKILLFLTGCAV